MKKCENCAWLPFCSMYDKKSVWISVEDRLPEEDIRVLVCIADNPYNYATMDTDRIFKSRWVRWNGRVRYWMPLPEPPETKGEIE